MEDILIKPVTTIVKRIENQFPRQQISRFAERLVEVTDSVAEVWPEQPNPKHLHIIVEHFSGQRCVHWFSEISLTVFQLSSTSFLTSLRLSSLPC